MSDLRIFELIRSICSVDLIYQTSTNQTLCFYINQKEIGRSKQKKQKKQNKTKEN